MARRGRHSGGGDAAAPAPPKHDMSLLDLPDELLDEVVRRVDDSLSLVCLARCHPRLRGLLAEHARSLDLRTFDSLPARVLLLLFRIMPNLTRLVIGSEQELLSVSSRADKISRVVPFLSAIEFADMQHPEADRIAKILRCFRNVVSVRFIGLGQFAVSNAVQACALRLTTIEIIDCHFTSFPLRSDIRLQRLVVDCEHDRHISPVSLSPATMDSLVELRVSRNAVHNKLLEQLPHLRSLQIVNEHRSALAAKHSVALPHDSDRVESVQVVGLSLSGPALHSFSTTSGALREIRFNHCSLTQMSLSNLRELLIRNPGVECLSLEGSPLPSGILIHAVLDGLGKHAPKLRELFLEGERAKVPQVIDLLEPLEHLSRFGLVLSHRKAAMRDADLLRLVRRHRLVSLHLQLPMSSVTNASWEAAFAALGSRLSVLKLGDLAMDDVTLIKMSHLLTGLERCEISAAHNITDVGASILFANLPSLRRFRALGTNVSYERRHVVFETKTGVGFARRLEFGSAVAQSLIEADRQHQQP